MQFGEPSHGEAKASSPKPGEPPLRKPVNLFVYPGDIQGWIGTWRAKDLTPFSTWTLAQLTDSKTLKALLDRDKEALTKRLADADYSTDNIAQLPGFIQAERQKYLQRRIQTIVVEKSDDLIECDHDIDNLIIETHGDHGKGFYIGRKQPSNFYCLETLRQHHMHLTALRTKVRGKIVLMGCELGRNQALLEGVARATDRPVIASKSWVCDWPGMFNDPVNRPILPPSLLGKLADLITGALMDKYGNDLADLFPNYARTVAPAGPFVAPILRPISRRYVRREIEKRVSQVLDGLLNSRTVSPSGSADTIFDCYYHPDFPYRSTDLDGVEKDRYGHYVPITKERMVQLHKTVGHWVEVDAMPVPWSNSGPLMRKRELTGFHFDLDGTPHEDPIPFDLTPFGKAYRELVAAAQVLQKDELKHLRSGR